LILQHFDEYQSPLVMGSQRSMMSMVCIVVGLLVFVFSWFLSYKMIFLLIGLAVVAAGFWGLAHEPPHGREGGVQRRKLVIRRKYTLFYILTFLSGARRQIFMVFSVLLLVKKFGFPIQQVTLLFVLNNAVNYFAAPLVARAIKRFGERAVLGWEYGSLVVIFTAYAFCPYKAVVAGLYMLDHISFNGSMAIRTYFQKIADRKDISAGTAVSFTINHIAAVVLPVVGGWLWMLNYRIPFIGGAVLGLFSLVAVRFIPSKSRCPALLRK
jgi:predicted MFS family arabinose efflux permease